MARSPQASGIPWRDKPYQTISDASALIGGSNSRTYALLAEGALEAVRLAGKTLVENCPRSSLFLSAKRSGGTLTASGSRKPWRGGPT